MMKPVQNTDTYPERQSKFSPDLPDARLTPDADLDANPEYQQLLVHYQNAEWDQCSQLIDRLLEQYPDRRVLLDFKADIDVQQMLGRMSSKKSRSKITKIIGSVLIVLVLVVLGVFAVGYFTQQTVLAYEREAENYQEQLDQVRQENITLLENQARSALQAGKPEVALEIADKIEAEDPQNATLASLRSEADGMLALVDLYDQAIQELSLENYPAALEFFTQIKTAQPLFRDVDYRINWIENHLGMLELIDDGESAYKLKQWQNTIQAYEQALTMDPLVNSPTIKDQLLYSYLNSIVETLSRDNHTIEELERSGTYYRKAIALIPQNKDYIAEREQLQSLSLELLVSKNYQMAKLLLGDPNHTQLNVRKAINFLSYASELKPDNQTYRSELSKAQLYLSILDAFEDGKLSQAISGLEDLARFDRQYPNGMGPVMLYEAYVAQGLKLHDDGFYRDARTNFEQAELIAWENREIKLQLFLVQIDLGKSIARLENYKDAVSYIEYAFDAISKTVAGVEDAEFSEKLLQARQLSFETKDYDAYLLYEELIADLDLLYEFKDVNVNSGESLFYIAYKNQSTIQAIQSYNDIEFPSVSQARKLSIPYLP